MKKLFVSLVATVVIFVVFYLGRLLVLELFNRYETSDILRLVAVIGLWILCYLIVTD